MKFILLLILISLYSCASSDKIYIDVNRYGAKDLSLNEEKHFFIWRNDSELNQLEFEALTKKFNSIVIRQRFHEVQNPVDAKYVISIKAQIDNGKNVISSHPIIGQTGVFSSRSMSTSYGNTSFTRTSYTPNIGIVGTSIQSHVQYSRSLELSIERIIDTEKNEQVYFARSISQGSSSNLIEIVPYLMKGVFEDFYSGSSKYQFNFIEN